MEFPELAQWTPGSWFHDVRDQLKWHVYRRSEAAFAAGDAARDALASREAVERRQELIRASLLQAIGGLPDGGDLDPMVTGTIAMDGFRIEKVIYQSRPSTYVTSLLYIPDGLAAPAPAILFLCGHAGEAKGYPEYQAVCQMLALAGFVVLAQDPIGQGERLSYWDAETGKVEIGGCCPEHDHAGAQCLAVGDTAARYFLHDAVRSIDYLCSRPEVDSDRIGLTGNSGGGTQSSLVMMYDRRIAAAAPGTFIMSRRSYLYTGGAQDAEQVWPAFSAWGLDHEDILLSLAPKPVLVLAVAQDFFPIEGTRETVNRIRRIWEMLGAPDAIGLAEDDTGHAYTPRLASAAVAFFSRHLMGEDRSVDPGLARPLPVDQTYCTRSGQVRGELPGAEGIFEQNAHRIALATAQRPGGTTGADWLRGRVGSHRTACSPNRRVYTRADVDGLTASAYLWRSQPDLMGHGILLHGAGVDPASVPLTLAVWDGGTSALGAHEGFARLECASGRSLFVLDVSGVGALAPYPLNSGCADLEFYGVIHRLADDLLWLGDDLPALRTFDVLAALRMLEGVSIGAEGARLYCHGAHGLYGRLAALLLGERVEVRVDEPGAAWGEWATSRFYDSHDIMSVVFRSALRHLDYGSLPG